MISKLRSNHHQETQRFVHFSILVIFFLNIGINTREKMDIIDIDDDTIEAEVRDHHQ